MQVALIVLRVATVEPGFIVAPAVDGIIFYAECGKVWGAVVLLRDDEQVATVSSGNQRQRIR